MKQILLATLLALGTAGASAQTFENVFGPTASVEQGARRVTPVRACPGGGFIAVGTTTVPGNPLSNVYLVRTTAAGAPMFERSYDLGPNTIDRGAALAEAADGSGFIIAGTTRFFAAGGTDDILLMKVSCGGWPLWSFAYGTARPDSALDVIEAQTGNIAAGTQRGDIVVAGSTINAANNHDGVLFRTRADGTPIWHRRYNVLSAFEVFRALTETRPIAPNPAGDIVAVGHFAWPGLPVQGYAVRVNGNDGLFGGPGPKSAVRYGVVDQVVFESVAELRQPGFAGGLAIVGNTRSTATGSDIVLVRTTADPAVPLAQRRIGDPAGGTFGEEVALDVNEVNNVLTAASPGSLALTGRLGRTTGVGFDAFLLIANPSTLQPSGAVHLYGDHADRLDSGVSVAEHAAGFVLAGFSSSDLTGVGDPRDLYLIGTDPSGKTDCSRAGDLPDRALDLPEERILPEGLPFLQRAPRSVQVIYHATAERGCGI